MEAMAREKSPAGKVKLSFDDTHTIGEIHSPMKVLDLRWDSVLSGNSSSMNHILSASPSVVHLLQATRTDNPDFFGNA